MPEFQCQNCGRPAELGHNCNGVPFQLGPRLNSIPASGSRKELLEKKGFHETSNLDGPFYRHPMWGIVAIYPGGAFATAYAKTDLPLDAYLDSLPDSSYTDIGPNPYEARCDTCGGVGPIFPDDYFVFLHKPDCPHTKP